MVQVRKLWCEVEGLTAADKIKALMNCDLHYVVVATKPREFPGAYASCVDEPKYLSDWAIERLMEGAVLQRMTCNQGHELMKQYVAWCDSPLAKGKA